MSRLRRAFWILRCADALDRGDLDASERLWIRAAVDLLTDVHIRTIPAEGSAPAFSESPPGRVDGD